MKHSFRRAGTLMLLVALVLCAGVPASQAAKKPLAAALKEKEVTLTEGETKNAVVTTIASTKSGTVTYSLTDTVNERVVYTESRSGLRAGSEEAWPLPYDDYKLSAGHPVKQMRATFVMDDQLYTLNLYYNYAQKGGQAAQITVEKENWYTNNTACSFGPQFRDIKPRLTDKWYMFTPIDLSQQGMQEFEYIASNMYVIGKVYVTVYGDIVMVSYENEGADQEGNTSTVSEYVTFFHDLNSVKSVDPNQLGASAFSFDQPIRISEDLQGDTNVLLFIRNEVTYSPYVTPGKKLVRFWPNLTERKTLREEMLNLMD
ncbi:MAG: hypothetical protein IJ189_00510 [Clostridia bacterium]|nr:hypothetical protein [Clostridia bacterium]